MRSSSNGIYKRCARARRRVSFAPHKIRSVTWFLFITRWVYWLVWRLATVAVTTNIFVLCGNILIFAECVYDLWSVWYSRWSLNAMSKRCDQRKISNFWANIILLHDQQILKDMDWVRVYLSNIQCIIIEEDTICKHSTIWTSSALQWARD